MHSTKDSTHERWNLPDVSDDLDGKCACANNELVAPETSFGRSV